MFDFFERNGAQSFGAILVLISLYLTIQGIARLYFSPIAKFPGPKLAALTYWYEFYYNVVLRGKYFIKIQELHQQYGPIIRINPHELQVCDPEFFDTVYTGPGQKRERDPWHTAGLALAGSILDTVPHDLHRKRRAALSPFFSMASTRRMLPVVEERVEALMRQLVALKGSEAPVNFLHALAAFSNDVISEYCFGKSSHRVEAEEFDPSVHKIEVDSAQASIVSRHLPLIPKILLSLPDYIAVFLGGGLAGVVLQNKIFNADIEGVRNRSSKTDRETIFHHLLESDLPESEKHNQRLINEAIVLIGAGSHTVAWALTVATYHMLSNTSILRNLKQELSAAKKSKGGKALTLLELEKLPYLTAVIKEGLRLSYGTSSRLPRRAPDSVLRYKDWVIPAGTSVSVSIVMMHHDESIFPDSKAFRPERWLEDKSGRLDKYMVAFSAGSRVCLGVNLAWAELYLCLTAIYSTFGCKAYSEEGDRGVLELFETDVGDVEMHRDLFFPEAKDGSKGVRVKITS
ncbi:Cyrochrome P450 monooxygenase [Lachnellula suecica]|uniref:Cyrochrome P450 monooxygenase n=1 Tax=Lachnellula suecica TaxID=602035 RepID=A0A8T9CBB7_9HELO|nr:Cyrochrome P450 monooxygenase [Lachnellula suecica]